MKSKWFINLFVGITKLTGILPVGIFFKPKIYLQEGASRTLPKSCILVSNHKSLLDFVLYLLVFPFRTIRFLMAEVLYRKGKAFSFMLNSLGGIKVDRDQKDFSFISDCIEVLEGGGTLGIFPEARLPINGKPFPFTTSTAFIAMNSGAKIVPVYTDGNYGLFKRTRVCIGKAFEISDFAKEGLSEQEQISHLTEVLRDKVYGLKTLIKSTKEKEKKDHKLFSFSQIPMDMARLVCAPLIAIFRIKRFDKEGKKFKSKLSGGAVVCANHTAFSDPFVVGVTFWYRRLYFLVAEVVMKNRLRTVLLKGVGAIKIDRNATDIEAITRSINKLEEGYLLSVFPQGAINREDNVDTVKSGAVLMAFRANVPIVPMHIVPQKKWYERKTVIIGSSINPKDFCNKKFPGTADINKVTEALAKELLELKAVAAGLNKE